MSADMICSFSLIDFYDSLLSLDRSLFLVISNNGHKLTVYDLEKRQVVFIKNSLEGIRSASFSEDLSKIIIAFSEEPNRKSIFKYAYRYIKYFFTKYYINIESFTGNSVVKIFALKTKTLSHKRTFLNRLIYSATFCNQDSELILSSFQYRKTPQEEDGNPVVIWDSKLTAPHYSMFMPRKEDDFYSTVASDRDTVATMGIYNFYLWKLSTKKIFLDLFESKNIDGTPMRAKTHKVRGDSEINCYCFSGDSTSVAIGLHYFSGASQQDNVCIYSIHADKALIKGWYSPYYAKKVALSYTGIYLGVIASYHRKNRFILYNTETKQELFTLEDEELTDVHFSKNDEIILCSESSVTIWKIDN